MYKFLKIFKMPEVGGPEQRHVVVLCKSYFTTHWFLCWFILQFLGWILIVIGANCIRTLQIITLYVTAILLQYSWLFWELF